MYLKSLTLKGFKSFADKTQMSFDPGLTVVVGPNGSGKSNVSDAILWVLGEQSAKQLRGQAMEDVIFSGSSARGAVGVAEVTLVLDNSDHTLPIDFNEVGITRRMYRSGESEYLINGSPSRLMDVQDILHDSGLGKDTHSIISQGKLDSILSSRPEERRALIEEAADISKHRRRKERSERKLASMDENLARAKVVSRELARQLKPLERQVDKAQRARALEDELKELEVQLYVDDLRRLQTSYNLLAARDKEADAAIELAQYRYDEKSRELEKLQSLLEQKGLFVGDLGEQRRRMQDILGRMDSDMRLLEEKGKNMISRLSDMRMQLSAMEKQRGDAAREHDRLADELSDLLVREEDLRGSVDELSAASHEAVERRRALDAEMARITSDERAARSEADRETLAYAKLEDQISNAEVEDEMFSSRLEQLDETVRTAEEALSERARHAERVEAELSEARERSAALARSITQRSQELVSARSAESEARTALSSAQATLDALRSVDAEVEKASPLVAALAAEAGDSATCRLADLIDADKDLESLVEQLLGDDLAALVVPDASSAGRLVSSALALEDAAGRATIVSLSAFTREPVQDAPGVPLAERLRVSDASRDLLFSLLGDVRLVDDPAAALAAHGKFPGLTFVTREGVAVLPDGRIHVGSAPSNETGALERKRRIRALEKSLGGLAEALEDAIQGVSDAESALAAAREEEAATKGEVARLSAELSSATSERGRLEAQISAASSERSQVTKRREAAATRAAEAREQIEGHRRAARSARARAEELADALSQKNDEHQDAIAAQGKASRALSDARLELAMTSERRANAQRRERELARSVTDLELRIASTERSSRALEVVRLRVDPLYDRYEAIRERALDWAARLKDRASLAEADSESLKRTIGEAREAVSSASAELERARSASSEVKVDLGKLEVQVEAAINAIVATGAVLDEALQIPAPDDREAAERRVATLKRQIESIGPVNAVAMDEYLRLKQRADYIDEQVADLESARASLKKITAAIDRKMRNRFLVVFEKVNRNFSEIFSLLFPGGQAHIEMTDPDNPSETGIEIVAQPRGKRIAKMMLMSGGEKSLTALALLFAVYKVRTVPFYVFDEVEAALDDSNLSKLLDAIERLKESTQLIVISHQRRTMEQADVLYGVSMQADGVSRVVSQRLDKATGKVVDA
ncbi:chromosome segregation protein SMC [Thermophilibacter provencensis]|uniref:Chromosome partition protein Smc n=1 Tax=Thermophilibacter provencensis TaxID=1852386 RepID=A0ABT7V355_9ACTN|nr:chromosome segregation protein SMC [Thermophilibacter provencensis]MDM8270429.1 chromosome segregation protein SMC [Thermophilibacter provencensis]